MIVEFSRRTGEQFGITPAALGISGWDKTSGIANWQREHFLSPDGWFGPASARAFFLQVGYMLRGLDVGRRRGLHAFYRRSELPQSILVHDTVTRSAMDMERILAARGLSTHFCIDEMGRILQYADPGSSWACHAAAFNQESIGIDVVNLLDPAELRMLKPLQVAPVDQERASRVVDAEWSASRVKGQAIAWTEAQRIALLGLIDVLCSVFGIRRVVPTEMAAFGKVQGIDDRTFRGVLAHAHFSTKRWDGLQVVPLLLEAGFDAWRRPE